MERKYADLKQLLEYHPGAAKFFETLPNYVKITITERGNNVCTEKALHTYANNLLQGDD